METAAPSTLSATGSKEADGRPLAIDHAWLFEQLKLRALHPYRVDIETREGRACCRADTENGLMLLQSYSGSLDPVLPAASELLAELAAFEHGSPLVARNTRHSGTVAWNETPGRAIVAALYTQEDADPSTPLQTELVRLLSTTLLRTVDERRTPVLREPEPVGWPLVDRRAPERPPWLLRLGTLFASCVLAASLWLVFLGLPQQEQATRSPRATASAEQDLTERTIRDGLSGAVAKGDYADLQDLLDVYASLRYFQHAAVPNPKGRVIALVGKLGGVRAGDAPKPEALANLSITPLRSGSAPEQWQLLRLKPASASTAADMAPLRMPVIGLAVASALGTVVLRVLQLPRRRVLPPEEDPLL